MSVLSFHKTSKLDGLLFISMSITSSHDEYKWWYKKNSSKLFSLSGFRACSNYRGVFFAKPLVAFPLAVGAPPVDLPVKNRGF